MSLGCLSANACMRLLRQAVSCYVGDRCLPATQDEYRNEPFTVVEADFYGANALMPLPDDELVAKVGPAQ